MSDNIVIEDVKRFLLENIDFLEWINIYLTPLNVNITNNT